MSAKVNWLVHYKWNLLLKNERKLWILYILHYLVTIGISLYLMLIECNNEKQMVLKLIGNYKIVFIMSNVSFRFENIIKFKLYVLI